MFLDRFFRAKRNLPTQKLSKVKAVVMDVDGILTDCRIWLDSDGEWRRAFTVRDGIGIKRLGKAGYKIGWITGSKAADIRKRAEMLGVDFLSDGQEDKTDAFKSFLEKFQLKAEEVAYIGDDLPDVPLLQQAGFAATVPEAVDEVLATVEYITKEIGGNGAARELCEIVLQHGFYREQV